MTAFCRPACMYAISWKCNPYIDGPLEEYFLTSNLFCYFISVNSVFISVMLLFDPPLMFVSLVYVVRPHLLVVLHIYPKISQF